MDGDLLGEAEPTADMRQLDGHADDEADDGEADDGEADDDADDDDGGHFLLDEDSDAPDPVPEEHPAASWPGGSKMLNKIGEGGMGTVVARPSPQARSRRGRQGARRTLQLRTGRERFIREGKALALLDHRNVVRVYDCDQLPDGTLFLCMQKLLEGDTLRALINGGVRPDPLEGYRHRQICVRSKRRASGIGTAT